MTRRHNKSSEHEIEMKEMPRYYYVLKLKFKIKQKHIQVGDGTLRLKCTAEVRFEQNFILIPFNHQGSIVWVLVDGGMWYVEHRQALKMRKKLPHKFLCNQYTLWLAEHLRFSTFWVRMGGMKFHLDYFEGYLRKRRKSI